MVRSRTILGALALVVFGVAVAVSLFFFAGAFTTHATQNPSISLDMLTTGNGYCDSAGVVTGGVTCANTITPPGTNCQVNDPGGSCNEMVVGTIDQCVTTTANNNTHNQAAQLIVQNVEDLVAWQVRVNYLGDKLRPGTVNFQPFTDTNTGQTLSFNNLSIDPGTALHLGITSASSIPSSGSTLSVAPIAGATSVTVASAAPYVVGNHVRVGPGTGNTNVDTGLTITNIVGTTLTISPSLSFAHNLNDPVFIADPQTALFGASNVAPPSGFDLVNSPDTPPKSPNPDDTSYAALSGGILATMNLSVAAGNAGAPSLFMNLDDGTPNTPGTSAVVFTGSGTSTIALDTNHLGDGFVGNGATCVPLNCVTNDCPPLNTPTPTPTDTPSAPGIADTATPQPSATPAIQSGIVEPGQPASIQDSSGEITVAFTGNETNQALQIDVQPTAPNDTQVGSRRIISQFSLDAYAVNQGDTLVTTFQAPVQLDIQLTFDQLAPYVPDSLGLYWYNKTTETWDPVAADVTFATGTIRAELGHFSEFSIQAVSGVILPKPEESFQVAAQSGAATASIPIELPKGPGGIVPDLSLMYSSSVVDEMKTVQSMASWVGAGWSLTTPSISRDPFSSRYYLSMPGTSGLIIRENTALTQCPEGFTGTCFRWHAMDDQYLQIISMECNDGTADVYNLFYVWTKDGTQYEFGTVPGNTTCSNTGNPGPGTALQSFAVPWASPAGWHQYHYRMDVSRITDTNGNHIDYAYAQDLRGYLWPCSTCNYTVRAAYPSEIDWSNFKVVFDMSGSWDVGTQCDSGDPNSNGGLVRRDSPVDDGNPDLWANPDGSNCTGAVACPNHFIPWVMETRQLDKIHVETSDGTQIREYDLAHTTTSRPASCYNGLTPSGNMTLDSIAEIGAGASGAPTLRTYQFTPYTNYSKRYRQNDSAPGYTDCPDDSFDRRQIRPYLTTAANGLGAQTSYSYQINPAVWGAPPGASCGWERMIVQQRAVDPGGGQAGQYYNYSNNSPVYWADNTVATVDAEFRGFITVTVDNRTSSTGGSSLGSLACTYHTESWLVGLESECRTNDPNGNALRTVTNTWDVSTITCGSSPNTLCDTWDRSGSPEFETSKFAKLKRTIDSITGRDDLTTDHQYDGYGNVTAICEYDGGYYLSNCSPSATQRLRLTQIYYATPNTASYIVDAEKQRDVFPNSGGAVSSVRSFYDGAGVQTVAPLRPLVTRTDQLTTGGTYVTTQTRGYNPNGSLATQTTWLTNAIGDEKDYTYGTCNGTTISQMHDVATAEYTYYSYENVSFPDGAATDHYGCLFQQPEQVTDPNGQLTKNEYDAFGRPSKTWQPGDTGATPTIGYQYDWDYALGSGYGYGDGTFAYKLDGTFNGLWSATWTDGLGRTIQTRNETASGSSIVDFVYDAAGNQTIKSQPYAGASGVSFSLPLPLNTTFAVYQYDSLGRITRVTDPTSANYRTTVYAGNLRTETDENSHQTNYAQDALGRTTRVDEQLLPVHTVYYTFNQLDLVTGINSDGNTTTGLPGQGGNETTHAYDGLGRKTDQNDVDTGHWTYTYDNNGEIASQTDARGVTISFNYDPAGRIATKSYSCSNWRDCCNALALVNGVCPSDQMSPTITYTYDTPPPTVPSSMCPTIAGIANCQQAGRLTTVHDWAGEHDYAYDARGRVTMSRDIISGTAYDTSHRYDSLDRATTLTYPGSPAEVVGYTYDASGLPSTMTSTINGTMAPLVSSAQYNFAGSPVVLWLGDDNVKLTFAYDDPELRLSSWAVQLVNSTTLTYDPAGNVKTIQDALPMTTYNYDERNRLTSVTGAYAATYTYDPLGNMTQKSENPALGPAETACTDAVDNDNDTKFNDGCTTSYSSITPVSGRPDLVGTATGINPAFKCNLAACTPSGDPVGHFSAQYSYDANGNIHQINASNDSELGLLWDAHNPATGQKYDAEGRLAWIDYNKIDTGGIAFYDIANNDCIVDISDIAMAAGYFGSTLGQPQPQYDRKSDLNSDGFVDITDFSRMAGIFGMHCPHFVYDYRGNLARLDGGPVGTTYIQGLYEKHDDGSVVKYYDFDGRRIAMSTKSSRGTVTRNYLALDGHGNTAYVLNSSGGQVSHTRYYPFGQVWTQEYFNGAPSVPTDKLFDGYTQEGASSGLYYAGARMYSADLGRFLSPDPVQSSNYANPQSLNPYSYVQNNPLTLTDPTGACVVDMPAGLHEGVRGCGPDRTFAVDERLYPTTQNSPAAAAADLSNLSGVNNISYLDAQCTAFGGIYCVRVKLTCAPDCPDLSEPDPHPVTYEGPPPGCSLAQQFEKPAYGSGGCGSSPAAATTRCQGEAWMLAFHAALFAGSIFGGKVVEGIVAGGKVIHTIVKGSFDILHLVEGASGTQTVYSTAQACF